jgi:hypothetical protein
MARFGSGNVIGYRVAVGGLVGVGGLVRVPSLITVNEGNSSVALCGGQSPLERTNRCVPSGDVVTEVTLCPIGSEVRVTS